METAVATQPGLNSVHQEAIYDCLFVLYKPAGTATFISKNADNEI